MVRNKSESTFHPSNSRFIFLHVILHTNSRDNTCWFYYIEWERSFINTVIVRLKRLNFYWQKYCVSHWASHVRFARATWQSIDCIHVCGHFRFLLPKKVFSKESQCTVGDKNCPFPLDRRRPLCVQVIFQNERDSGSVSFQCHRKKSVLRIVGTVRRQFQPSTYFLKESLEGRQKASPHTSLFCIQSKGTKCC